MRVLGMLKWETDGMLQPYGLPLRRDLEINPYVSLLAPSMMVFKWHEN